ncbi:hypothetical protein Pelo_26 [Pelomyxa schiedti]|nr:hypothetical protein Pelo_26 [Pelomyxa schiedti]
MMDQQHHHTASSHPDNFLDHNTPRKSHEPSSTNKAASPPRPQSDAVKTHPEATPDHNSLKSDSSGHSNRATDIRQNLESSMARLTTEQREHHAVHQSPRRPSGTSEIHNARPPPKLRTEKHTPPTSSPSGHLISESREIYDLLQNKFEVSHCLFSHVYLYDHWSEAICAFTPDADAQFQTFTSLKTRTDLFFVVCHSPLPVGVETIYYMMDSKIKECLVLFLDSETLEAIQRDPTRSTFPPKFGKKVTEQLKLTQQLDKRQTADVVKFFS